MDATTQVILERITERYSEKKRIYSGHSVSVFYNCALLTPSELARLASVTLGDQPSIQFDIVLGLAYRGILFGAALAHGREITILQQDQVLCGPALTGKRVLIVDDVIRSGRRLLDAAKVIEKHQATTVAFAALVDRSEQTFQPKNARGEAIPVYSAWQASFE